MNLSMGENSHEERATRAQAVFSRLAAAQTAQPWRFIVLAFLTTVLALLFASQLSLKSALGQLLPSNKQSVLVAEKVKKRLAAVSTLSVLVEGSSNEGLKHFVDKLAPAIEKLGPPLVGAVDGGIHSSRQFIRDYRFLYAPLKTVQAVHDEILERYAYEVNKRAGFLLDEDEPPPPLTEATIQKRLDEQGKKSGLMKKAEARYPDGYYLDEKAHKIVVLVRTPLSSGDVKGSQKLVAAIRSIAQKLNPSRFDPAIKLRFGGNLLTSAEVRAQIESDLAHVGAWGVFLILSVVFLYYLRIRTLIAMTLSIAIGASWTFGCAYLLVGHLNSSTGFLFSIVVGNGINFGIIYMARYLEARRNHNSTESLAIAHQETWGATLTAAVAAGSAYGSLIVTNFRGFKEFGIIGGSGMILCWIATYLFLPPILLLFERLKAIQPPSGWLARLRGGYGRPFAALASGYPRTVLASALALSVVSSYFAYGYLRADPMEYNMRRIGNAALKSASEASLVGRTVGPIVGRQGVDGLAIATERLEQVLPLKAALLKRRDAATPEDKPFDNVVTIYSLIPKQQEAKLKLSRKVRATLKRSFKRGFLAKKDWDKLNQMLPANRLHSIGMQDLPEQMARPFTEKDGSRGRLVYVSPTRGQTVWDGHYLIRWAQGMRTTKLPDGSTVHGSGRSVVFADVILAVAEDAPKAVLVSLLLTLLVVLIAFRARGAGVAVILSVLIGLVWTVGFLALCRSDWPWGPSGQWVLRPLKLNFLNFVALPITIGVGADYAVNVMKRRSAAGQSIEAMRRAVVETGGAVVLCSLTTTLGYAALTLSVNRAVQGFGMAAVAGEIACVLSGVLVLPAYLWWRADSKPGPSKASSAQT